jgi:cell division protein FtsB
VDALVGDRGFVERLRMRRKYADTAATLDAMRRDNARLRVRVQSLREDGSAIEAIAREDLGLMRPGEILFVVRDARPASR